MDEPIKEPPKGNGMSGLLTTIAGGGDNWIKLATLALVAISGSGNFLATTKTADYNGDEIRRAVQEIHDIHGVLVQTVDRQKDMYDIVRRLERRSWNSSQPTPTPH